MRIAYMGSNYCGQFLPPPDGHEAIWMPYAPLLGQAFAAAGVDPSWPDVLVVVLAETYPLPMDMETCPCPTVAILVDWQQWADALLAHAPAFDLILVDGSGAAGLSPLLPGKVRTFSPMGNFSGVTPDDPPTPLAERPHDVAFIGRFSPPEQYAGRVKGLSALYPLAHRYNVRILSGLSPEAYRDALCSTKIIVNHAAWPVQEGMNARNIEASVCGALVLSESSNLGVSSYFDHDEALFYDEATLADQISWALTHVDEAQAMADRARKKASVPRTAEYLAILEDIVGRPRQRTKRSPHDALTGLCCGFGNWGSESGRPPGVIQAMLELSQRRDPELTADARWHDLLGVALAEIAGELDSMGQSHQADRLRANPALAPDASWLRAVAADASSAHPLYNLGRYWVSRREWRRAWDLLGRARDLLRRVGPDAVEGLPIVYPVRAEDVSGLDRTLAFHANATPFESGEERLAALLLWRTCELLGDIAERTGRRDDARTLYEEACEACPDIATSALRKLLELAVARDDTEWQMACCRRIVDVNPLDLRHRDLWIAMSRSSGATDQEFEADTELLRTALASSTPREPSPVERL